MMNKMVELNEQEIMNVDGGWFSYSPGFSLPGWPSISATTNSVDISEGVIFGSVTLSIPRGNTHTMIGYGNDGLSSYGIYY